MALWQGPTRQEATMGCTRPLLFAYRVLVAFQANQGLLLAGAVAYYTLLSIIPLFTLLLIILTRFIDQAQLLEVLAEHLNVIIPERSENVVQQIAWILEQRDLLGWIGFIILLFFSSLAFTMLEKAMSVIFHHRVRIRRRHLLLSAVLPYLYIAVLGIALLAYTLVGAALDSMQFSGLPLPAWATLSGGLEGAILYILSLAGLALLFTSLYLVMPVGRLAWRHALVGGITATVLWEAVRHLLAWYFSTLSMVNVVYGSFATVIIILLSLEIGAVILLLGAQVIAEYERGAAYRLASTSDRELHT